MASLTTMVKRCMGLIDTKDITPWENSFLVSIQEKTKSGDDTRPLTEKQIEVVEKIFSKHFAD